MIPQITSNFLFISLNISPCILQIPHECVKGQMNKYQANTYILITNSIYMVVFFLHHRNMSIFY